MKNEKNWIRELLSDETGSISSKRTCGVVIVCILLMLVPLGIGLEIELSDNWKDVLITLTYAALGLLGVTEIRKFVGNKKNETK